jgi:hypothetical protein
MSCYASLALMVDLLVARSDGPEAFSRMGVLRGRPE